MSYLGITDFVALLLSNVHLPLFHHTHLLSSFFFFFFRPACHFKHVRLQRRRRVFAQLVAARRHLDISDWSDLQKHGGTQQDRKKKKNLSSCSQTGEVGKGSA